MKNRALKYVIFLALLSIAGVLTIQLAIIRSSYRFSNKQFRESCAVALKEVSWKIFKESGRMINFDSIAPVHVITDDYYIVKTEIMVDEKLLRFHLMEELMKHNIYSSFEYAIFNPSKSKMEYAVLVTEKMEFRKSDFKFPLSTKYPNYFAVHFPNKSDYFNSKYPFWYLLIVLLFLVLSFFGYTLYVIFRQRQLSEIQKNFINNLTHELKTPISSIALSVNVLSDKKIMENPQRMFEYIRIIREQNQRLSKNVEKVLNLASIEKNKLQLKLSEIDLYSFVNETVEHFKLTPQVNNARITVHDPGFGAIIKTDPFHLSNLIFNILENAVKYCEKQPEIDIVIGQQKNNIQLMFRDNGIGIPDSEKNRVFKKFYRVPTGNIHNVKGFGLGLDYVHKIVVAQKWKISINDNKPNGSIFVVIIPVKK